MRGAVVLAYVLWLSPLTLQATTVGVYYNRADWEAAMSVHGKNSLTSISFNDSLWTEQMQFLPQQTQKVSASTTAASDGTAVTAVSGYSIPGMADNSTLGHVSNGLWIDSFSKYGTTTFQFSNAIYGFGGDFDIAQGNGLFFGGVGQVAQTHGFVGFITDQRMDSLLISWGDAGGCPRCFGNSYSLTNLEVATLPTPEPNYQYVLPGLLVVIAGYKIYRRS